MKLLPLILGANILFGYSLVVYSKKDANRLNDIGFICEKRGGKYICLDSNDLDELKRIESFLINKFGIKSYIINDEVKKVKKSPSNTKVKKHSIKNKSINEKFTNKKNVLTNKKVYYCVQLGSFKNFDNAKRLYEKFKKYPFARLEKIGDFYVVRIGKANSLNDIKEFKKFGLIKRCYILKDRIIYSNFRMN